MLGGIMESNGWYYRRRACEELIGASRAITDAARERRLYLVRSYLNRLHALGEPSPFPEESFAAIRSNGAVDRSAFDWARAGKRG